MPGGELTGGTRWSRRPGPPRPEGEGGVFRHGGRALLLVWRTSRLLTVLLSLLTLVTGVVPAAAAYVGKLVVDGVVRAAASGRAEDLRTVLGWVALEGSLIVLVAGAQRGIVTCQALLRALLGHRISTAILQKALTLRLEHFEDPVLHDRMMRARQEATSRPLSLVNFTFALITNAVSLASYGWLLLQFSGWAVLIVAAAGVPAFIVEARYSRHAFRFFQGKTPEMRERAYIERLITIEDFAKELLVFRIGPKLLGRYNEIFQRLYAQDRRIQLRRGLWGFALGSLGAAALYGAYAWIILETVGGRLTIGEMTMYLVLFRQGQAAVTGALTAVGGLYQDNLYLSNLFTFLEHEVEPQPGEALSGPEPDEGIRFEGVSFTYPGTKRPAVKDVSFSLRPGQKLALVGQNGSGKTTLVKLLTRLHDPESGRITLDGRDLKEWSVEALRARIAVIFQDFVRFKLTVGENIGVGDVEHLEDEERWEEAARLGTADRFIARLPERYLTRLGKAFRGGHELSGGQWQKVALARAFMRKGADIFVLDEPTAAMDAEAEARIFEHVRKTTEERMTIFISHRLAAARTADEILVLADGEIAERGDHETLMARGGRYYHLFQLQSEAYK